MLGRGALAAWVALWGGELFLALLRGNDSGAALRGTFASGHSTGIALPLATLLAVTLVAAFLPAPLARPLLSLSLLLAGAIWVTAQDFGGIFTGRATDPNSGPLLLLVVLAYWPFWGASYAGARLAWRLFRPSGSAPGKVQTF